jgi:four helix bundle protein
MNIFQVFDSKRVMPSSRPMPGSLWIVQLAGQISSRSARHVQMWGPMDRNGIGDQLIRAADSIGLNLSEGYARFHLKERLHFISIAQGSLEETLFAVRQARERGLLTRLDASVLSGMLIRLSNALRVFSKSLAE